MGSIFCGNTNIFRKNQDLKKLNIITSKYYSIICLNKFRYKYISDNAYKIEDKIKLDMKYLYGNLKSRAKIELWCRVFKNTRKTS